MLISLISAEEKQTTIHFIQEVQGPYFLPEQQY